MLKYFIKKLILTILVLFGVATCAFLLLKFIPGDPAEALAGPQATLEDIENLRRSMGLDAPIGEQYVIYMINLVKGDFGYSYRTNKPVREMIFRCWPATLQLSLVSLLMAILVGVPLGIYAATKRGTLADTISMVLAFIGLSMPSFWLGLLLILIFGVKFPIFPFYGRQGLSSFVLPSLTVGWGIAANIARMTRASMLEVLGQDYIRTARGKGLKEGKVIYIHALRNASISIITIIGLQMGHLLGGQVVTETIFSWPGVGRMIVDALMSRDLQIVQMGIIVIAFTFSILNLLTDLSYAILDPRIRY